MDRKKRICGFRIGSCPAVGGKINVDRTTSGRDCQIGI